MKSKCDSCSTEFEIKLNEEKDVMQDGTEVSITFFTCSYCGERFIICVEDEAVIEMKNELQAIKSNYRKVYDPENPEDTRKLRREIDYRKRQLFLYSSKLLNKYSKEHSRG